MIIKYQIPDNTDCLVKEGNKIDFQTALFEKKYSKEETLNIAQILNINPQNIFRHLKKLVGEKIEKDEVIAIKKGLFTTQTFKSPYEGVIKEINHHQGILLIEVASENKKQILSPFKGIVEKVEKNQLAIKLNKPVEFEIKKTKTDFGGDVFYLEEDQVLTSDEVENKIILAEKIDQLTQIKLEALGAKAFITSQPLPENTDLNYAQIKNLNDFKKIEKLKYPYCTVIFKSDKIYFYL
ncbi:MAG: hypothetical protein ACPLRN_00965 [Microgenomates group bacterium]